MNFSQLYSFRWQGICNQIGDYLYWEIISAYRPYVMTLASSKPTIPPHPPPRVFSREIGNGIFTFMLPCAVIDFFLNNQPDGLIIQIYSDIKIYMFRAVPLPIIRSLFTVHSAMVCVIQVCRQLSNRSRMVLLESYLQTCMTYTTAECIVNKLLMMGRGTA